jgi:hypothetical protein
VKAGEEMLKAPFLKKGVEKPVFRQSKETFNQMWEEVAAPGLAETVGIGC